MGSGFGDNKAKRSVNQQRSDVLICFCLLASERSDKAKRLEQKNKKKKLHSVGNSGGPL